MPARRGWMDDVGRLCEMVRGLCPRDCIRWAVEGGGRTVSDVGAIGHAGRVRLTRPGGHANAGRRGRRPLRAAAKRRYQHRGKQMRKGENLLPRLGSPERGAVAAFCAVTEGLVQRGCGAPTLPVIPRRAGVEAGWRVEPTPSVDRRRRTGDGAPYEANCKDTQQTHAVRYPEEGASRTPPPTVVARCRCQRSRKVQFITPVTFYAASPVSLLHVGCTVLGAPRSRDHRGGIDASARVDRF